MTPYPERDNWELWTGIEVEGRFKGLPTLFVGKTDKLDAILEASKRFPHVYINPQFVEAKPFDMFQWLKANFSGSTQLTLCLTPYLLEVLLGLKQRYTWGNDLFEDSHIMLTIDLPKMGFIKLTDTLRIVYDPYRCVSFTVHTAWPTNPYDYRNDQNLIG